MDLIGIGGNVARWYKRVNRNASDPDGEVKTVEFFAGEDRDLPGVPFFDGEGNRRPGTGEHIVWLRPRTEGSRTLPQATITVWRLRSDDPSGGWQRVGQLDVSYDGAGVEGNHGHAGD